MKGVDLGVQVLDGLCVSSLVARSVGGTNGYPSTTGFQSTNAFYGESEHGHQLRHFDILYTIHFISSLIKYIIP